MQHASGWGNLPGTAAAASLGAPPASPAPIFHFQQLYQQTQHFQQDSQPSGVLTHANHQRHASTMGAAAAAGGPKVVAAAAAARALSQCKRLTARLRQAADAQELFEVVADGWQALDCINLSAVLHRLSQLAEAFPGGTAAFARSQLLGDPRWAWLLDQVPSAAASPGFGPQCVANTMAALCRLDAFSPPLLHALHAPLLRALTAPAPADRLSTRGLTQVLWCISKDLGSVKPLVLAVKGQLWEALWAAAPCLDAQGVATAWGALGRLSTGCSAEELHQGAHVPDLLPRLAAATRAVSAALTFPGIAQVLLSCTQMKPEPYQDEALLQALAAAAARRLHSGEERPPPEAVGHITLAFGRLGFVPRHHWCPQRGVHVNVLDKLGAALVAQLPVAKAQAPCLFLVGLAALRYVPPGPVLTALLDHLGGTQNGGRAASRARAASAAAPDGQAAYGSVLGADGRLAAGDEATADGQLVLQQLSCQELADLLRALLTLLDGGPSGQASHDGLVPPAVLEQFFDALDTVLQARASFATHAPAAARPDSLLTGQHVGAILGALGRLAAAWPCAVLTDATLVELESHVLANAYSGGSLASFLHYFALTGTQPGNQAVEGVCQRALTVHHRRELPLPLRHPQQGFTLGALAKMLASLAALRINQPPLLCALLPAVGAALEAHQRAAAAGAMDACASSLRELASLAAALGQLQAAGLLGAAGLASPEALLPLWRQLMQRLAHAAFAGGAAGKALMPEDAAAVQQAAGQLNVLCGGRPAFWLPPAVSRVLDARS